MKQSKPPQQTRRNLQFLPLAFSLAAIFIAVYALTSRSANFNLGLKAAKYNPKINPEDFTTKITNKYMTLTPGKKMLYEGETEDGLEKIVIQITDKTKKVMGVTTVVYWDRAYLDGELIEDTRDYLAQDKKGNVWYFGESVDNYEDGELIDHDGSWLAGKDGAKPGIWFEDNPQVGDTYRQEYYQGEAEDMAKVLSTNEKVATPFGTFKNCVKTLDWTPLEPGLEEHKYYCPQVGAMVLEENPETSEKLELIDIKNAGKNDNDDNDEDDNDDDDED